MCFVSVVYDNFRPYIPPNWVMPDHYTVGTPQSPTVSPPQVVEQAMPPLSPEHIRQLVEAFRLAEKSARTLDRLTGQPDCEDPEKAKILERVERIEQALGIEQA